MTGGEKTHTLGRGHGLLLGAVLREDSRREVEQPEQQYRMPERHMVLCPANSMFHVSSLR
jgi:hypothetical protein